MGEADRAAVVDSAVAVLVGRSAGMDCAGGGSAEMAFVNVGGVAVVAVWGAGEAVGMSAVPVVVAGMAEVVVVSVPALVVGVDAGVSAVGPGMVVPVVVAVGFASVSGDVGSAAAGEREEEQKKGGEGEKRGGWEGSFHDFPLSNQCRRGERGSHPAVKVRLGEPVGEMGMERRRWQRGQWPA